MHVGGPVIRVAGCGARHKLPERPFRTVQDLRLPSVKTHGRVVSGHPLGVLWHAGTVRGGTSRRVPKILDFREWATSGRPLGDQWAPSFAKWAIRFGTISLSGRPLMHGRVVSGHTAGALWDGGASGVIYFGVCRKNGFR